MKSYLQVIKEEPEGHKIDNYKTASTAAAS